MPILKGGNQTIRVSYWDNLPLIGRAQSASMDRIFYRVTPHALLWEVRSYGQFDLQLHDTQGQAFLAAASSAKQRFASTGTSTGLHMQASDRSSRQLDVVGSGELGEQPRSI